MSDKKQKQKEMPIIIDYEMETVGCYFRCTGISCYDCAIEEICGAECRSLEEAREMVSKLNGV